MKKAASFLLVALFMFAPLSSANFICEGRSSESYGVALGAKIMRGLSNIGFSWVELIRQPMIQENKWEGVGRGFVHMGGRILSGAAEIVTSLIPGADIPAPDPACPTDMFNFD